MTQARGWRFVLTCVAVTVALTLVGCTSDQRGRPSTPTEASILAVTPLPNEYDLVDNNDVPINGARWISGLTFKVGTGLINPFLSVQNAPSEQGFNTDGTFNYDQTRTQFTNKLPLNVVPVIKVGGVFYREFILDANEANSGLAAQFSIDRFDLWLCNDPSAPTFALFTDFRNNSSCHKVYDLGEKGGSPAVALATDGKTNGSGNSLDYEILIPETAFEATGLSLDPCAYNPVAADCGLYLILDTQMGAKGGDWVTGSTFEEFSTVQRPFVSVSKTAVPTFKRTYKWQIHKAVDPVSITQFIGQSSTATWSITVSPDNPPFIDSDALVAGTITITNPSATTVTILSIADAIPGFPAVSLTCPSGTTNVVLASNASYVCTYSVTPPNTNSGAHTNTVNIELDPGTTTIDAVVSAATATFDFANASPTEVDKNPNVYDNYNKEGEVLLGTASIGTFSYQKTYTCGQDGQFSNAARVDLADPATDLTASASLTVKCLDLKVTKDAQTALTRTYKWLINKNVTPKVWNLFKGDDGTSEYTVTATPNGFDDMSWSVSGNIHVHNPNSVPVYLTGVTDAIGGVLPPASMSCPAAAFPTEYTLVAGATLDCTYSSTLPDGTDRTNTATATAKPTQTGTEASFTGTASVSFTGVSLTEVNKTVDVTDSYQGGAPSALGQATFGNDPTVFTFPRTFSCDADAGTKNNTATITQTGQSANASVTVNCYTVTVDKTANTSFDRDWNWSVVKSADQSGPLTLALGQPFLVNYSIVVTKLGPFDDNWQVKGTISVTNNHPSLGADLKSLADAVSGVGNANVTDCQVSGTPKTFPFTLDAKATLTCQYSLSTGDATQRLNTATATQQNHSYDKDGNPTLPDPGTTAWSGTKDVIFSSTPTNETDECANVSDSYGGPLNTNLCESHTFTYQRDAGSAQVCGPYTVQNTATLTPNDNPINQTSSVSIPVDVPCPQGCTLTQGYWKTHNASFHGGAPLDDNWDKVTPFKELSGFFTTANSYPITGPNDINTPFTWFSVFWTAPKGNAYYNLADQYMAAKLNILNGASAPQSVTNAIALAEDLFGDGGTLGPYTPAQLLGLKGSYSLRQQFISLAGTLGSYNEGTIGPGHCSEDGTSTQQLPQ